MTPSSREAFLQRVNQALQESNRPGVATDIPSRGNFGYQGAGPDPLDRFCAELTATGGHAYRVGDGEAVIGRLLELARAKSARQALLGRGKYIDSLALADRLRAAGLQVVSVEGLKPEHCREPFFAADVGITGVDYLIAETGSVALLAKPAEPRSYSLLPPVHIAIAHQNQILPDLFDLFSQLGRRAEERSGRPKMPSCLSLITGPSKTGDIELRLVTGVHGPGEIHVIVVTS